MKNFEKCLIPGCDEKGNQGRGLCRDCYAAMSYRISKNNTSWEELVQLGLAKQTTHGSVGREKIDISGLIEKRRAKATAK